MRIYTHTFPLNCHADKFMIRVSSVSRGSTHKTKLCILLRRCNSGKLQYLLVLHHISSQKLNSIYLSMPRPRNFIALLMYQIIVAVPPNIDDSLSSSDVIVREGANETLTCRATGSPQPSVKWKRDDNSKISINKTLTGNYIYPWTITNSIHCSAKTILTALFSCLNSPHFSL